MAIATLSIDLVARLADLQSGMDRAGRLTEQQAERMGAAFDKVNDRVNKLGGAIAGYLSGTVIVGAFSAIVNGAHEVANAARIAGAGVEEFQRWGIAVETVGISQEKLGDQLKDFREKVGEFVATGGGGMKDFFEQVAPKIGITADAFRDLSGPEAMQLYYDSLQKAGLSQEQMSFYLESMASDTTALIPLLRDGGKAFQEIGDRAQRMGRIIESDTVDAARNLRADLKELTATSGALAVQLAGPTISALSDMSRYILQVAQTEGIARAALISFGRVVAGVFGTDEYGKLESRATAAQAHLQRLTGMAERYQEAINRGDNVPQNTRNLERIRARIAEVSKEATAAAEALKSFATDSDANKPQLPALAPASTAKWTPPDTDKKKGKSERDEIAAYIEQLDKARDRVLELTEEEKALKLLQGTDKTVSAATRDRLLSLAAEIDETRDLVELKKLEGQARAEIAKQAEADEKRLEALRGNTDSGREAARLAELAFLHRQYTDGRIANEKEYQELVDATNKKFKEGLDDASKAAQELGMTFSSAFESAVMGGQKLKDVAAGLLKDVAGIGLRKGVTEPMAKQLTDLLKGDGKNGGDIAGTVSEQFKKGVQSLADSDIFKGLGDSLGKVLSNVFDGASDWLGELAKGFGSLFSGAGGGGGFAGFLGSLFSFDGGGSTGNGARSGGLDGKGGFLAMLHPQETVTDHFRGQSGGVQASAQVVNVTINNTSGAQVEATAQRNPQGGTDLVVTVAKAVQAAMAADVASRTGPMYHALNGGFMSRGAR